MILQDESEVLSQTIQADVFNATTDKYPGLVGSNLSEFIRKCTSELVDRQLDAFPTYCDITRRMNWEHYKVLESIGKKGKYTDSIGWSQDGQFKFDFIIPRGLYFFMLNMVSKEFWEERNEKIWRKFMNRICRGDEPYELLMSVKTIFGPSNQEGIILN